MRTATPVVTRIEIAEVVEAAFDAGPAEREALINTAIANGARLEVIALLQHLPARRFLELRQLWDVLSDVPVGAHA